MVKLLIGGSPCTHWSIAKPNNREVIPQGVGWELFKNYLIAKRRFHPDLFLYENNKSAAAAIKDQISTELNAPLQYINSALVSAQNRQRFYVHDFGNVPQPEDRGILLRDILESGVVDREKAYCLKHQEGNARDYFKKRHTQIAFEPVNTTADGKAQCLRATYYKDGIRNLVGNNIDRKTCVAVPIRIGTIGSNSQAHRVYSPDGKSTTLCGEGGGVGGKTGLYACPIETPVYIEYNAPKNSDIIVSDSAIRCQRRDAKHSTVQGTCVNYPHGKSQTLLTAHIPQIIESASPEQANIYQVRNGLITIKDEQYSIKLADGHYIIRKLSPVECERLQTLPDGYTAAVSDTQRYRGLGNGWTAEVIIHLLAHALRGVPKREKIVVLSMYDGIGTGRYCLDRMGFKNVWYYAYEIDKYAIKVAQSNYPDIVQCGDAFSIRTKTP